MKNIIGDYREFIRNFVGKNPIMSKTFFIVVPFDPIKIPKVGKRAAQKAFGLFKKKAPKLEKSFVDNVKELELRVDRVVSGLNRIGLRAIPLAETEITELLYNFYNPATVEKKGAASARK